MIFFCGETKEKNKFSKEHSAVLFDVFTTLWPSELNSSSSPTKCTWASDPRMFDFPKVFGCPCWELSLEMRAERNYLEDNCFRSLRKGNVPPYNNPLHPAQRWFLESLQILLTHREGAWRKEGTGTPLALHIILTLPQWAGVSRTPNSRSLRTPHIHQDRNCKKAAMAF